MSAAPKVAGGDARREAGTEPGDRPSRTYSPALSREISQFHDPSPGQPPRCTSVCWTLSDDARVRPPSHRVDRARTARVGGRFARSRAGVGRRRRRVPAARRAPPSVGAAGRHRCRRAETIEAIGIPEGALLIAPEIGARTSAAPHGFTESPMTARLTCRKPTFVPHHLGHHQTCDQDRPQWRRNAVFGGARRSVVDRPSSMTWPSRFSPLTKKMATRSDVVQRSAQHLSAQKHQEEVAGRDGEEAMARVLRLAVTLRGDSPSAEWGSTRWTRIEETCIRNHAPRGGP